MGPYSMDLRERVAAAIDQGESQRQVARRFGVSLEWHSEFRKSIEQPGIDKSRPPWEKDW
jgi:transposase